MSMFEPGTFVGIGNRDMGRVYRPAVEPLYGNGSYVEPRVGSNPPNNPNKIKWEGVCPPLDGGPYFNPKENSWFCEKGIFTKPPMPRMICDTTIGMDTPTFNPEKNAWYCGSGTYKPSHIRRSPIPENMICPMAIGMDTATFNPETNSWYCGPGKKYLDQYPGKGEPPKSTPAPSFQPSFGANPPQSTPAPSFQPSFGANPPQSTPAPSFQPSFVPNPDTGANSLPIQPSFSNPSVSPEPPKNNSYLDIKILVIINIVVVGVTLLLVFLLIKNKI